MRHFFGLRQLGSLGYSQLNVCLRATVGFVSPLALPNALHYAAGMSELENPDKVSRRPDTRAHLMEAAERLFGERGLQPSR